MVCMKANIQTQSVNAPTELPPAFPSSHRVARRSFLRRLGLGAALLAPGAALFTTAKNSRAADNGNGKKLTKGDADILRFLAAAEIIETDLWQQYTELGGQDAPESSYRGGLEILDEDQPQYISDNTDDEQSHVNFLNAYLHSKGEKGVNLDAFRTLPSSQATGAQQIGRLTNLTQLTVDTSWWTRYRSTTNPDLGATFPHAWFCAMRMPSRKSRVRAAGGAPARAAAKAGAGRRVGRDHRTSTSHCVRASHPGPVPHRARRAAAGPVRYATC